MNTFLGLRSVFFLSVQLLLETRSPSFPAVRQFGKELLSRAEVRQALPHLNSTRLRSRGNLLAAIPSNSYALCPPVSLPQLPPFLSSRHNSGSTLQRDTPQY